MKSMLVVAAHLDDIEIGMGGTFLKLIDEKINPCVVVMCSGDVPNRKTDDHDDRVTAFYNNMRSAGVDANNIITHSFPSNELHMQDTNLLISHVSSAIDTYQPEIVFTTNYGDVNQDHRVMSGVTRVATRPRHDMCVDELYEFPIPGSTEWNHMQCDVNHIVDVTKYHKKKLQQISQYKTEIRPDPDPCSLEKIKARDVYLGGIYGMKYAEGFRQIFRRLR